MLQENGTGRLLQVIDPDGKVSIYNFDASHRMLTLKDKWQIAFLIYSASAKIKNKQAVEKLDVSRKLITGF